MFATTMEGGMCMGFPDTCLVPAPPAPPIPTPFPNIAMPMMADPTTVVVFIAGMPALFLDSEIPLSNGDQAGLAGGVASGMMMGPARAVMGSFAVMLEGIAAVRLSDPTLQNDDNAPGIIMAPSQPTVMILS
jgi:hypothetical protein